MAAQEDMNPVSGTPDRPEGRILLVSVPSRRGKGGRFVPLGLLYVGRIAEANGFVARIYDPHLNDENLTRLDSGDYAELDRILADFRPEIVGFGGIASSYGRTKKLSLHIAKNNPGILQIAGGPLASVYDLLLQKSNVDVVFHGETERTLPVFLERFRLHSGFLDIPGISAKAPDGSIARNPPAPQIENLDEVPFPAYHLVDLKAYDPQVMYMITSRGCTHRCSFCYRHMKGHRQNSVPYVIEHIRFAMQNFGFRQFTFADELFNANEQWVLEFCDALAREKLAISFATSMRADIIDEPLLKRLKEAGCTEIFYGQESGSNTILKEYRKGVDAKTNTEVTLMTRRLGMKCPVQIVIGSPSETPETIEETTRFLIDLGEGEISINYLIPYPETPVWKYVHEHHLVGDIERYLDEVSHWGGSPVLNLTQVPDNLWRTWSYRMKTRVSLALLRKEGKTAAYLRLLVTGTVVAIGYRFLPETIIRRVRDRRVYG